MANRYKNAAPIYRIAGMGLELGGSVAGCCLIGWYIDHKYETRYGILIGAAFGIVGGLYNFIRQALAITQREQSRSDESPDDMDGPR